MKIWCIEDDTSIRDMELYTLTQTGFEAEGFSEGAAMWVALDRALPDLILLDVMLPGEDGVELLKKLRDHAKTEDIPVIMTAAKGMEYDKVQSLDLGADDYLVKPFGMMEMVSRIKAVLRRTRGRTRNQLLKVGGLVLNSEEHSVLIDGKPISLTLKEYKVLKLLLSHTGTVYDRNQLFFEVWGENYIGESRTVDVHIRTLRQKLGPYRSLIKTVRGVGYRMDDCE